MSVSQQTTGINTIMTMSNSLLEQAGVPNKWVTLSTCGITLLNVLMTLVAVPLIDSLGRKSLLLISSAICVIAMGAAFLIQEFFWKSLANPQTYIVCCLLLFIIGFAMGLGPVLWIYLSEIYPAHLKGSCMSLAVTANWVASALVVFILGVVQNKLGPATYFGILTVTNIVGFLFVLMFVVETKGSDVEDCPLYVKKSKKKYSRVTATTEVTTANANTGEEVQEEGAEEEQKLLVKTVC